MRSLRGQGAAVARDDYATVASAIEATFHHRLAGLRRRVRPQDMAVAVRALQVEKQAALKALRDSRAARRKAERRLSRRPRAPERSPAGWQLGGR